MAARVYPQPANRVAIGIKRVSLLKQVGNYSFDGQGNKFAKLAAQHHCEIPTELMIEDKGYSGTDFNRPSIKKAQNMIRAGVANAVAFPWVDRFAREVEGGLATIRQFRELGADVLLGDLGWYSNESHFRLQMHLFMAVAQFQRDDIVDKSKAGVQAKLDRGLAHYGAPYGWHMVTALEIAARAVKDGLPVPPGRPQNFYERVLDDLDVVRLMGEIALAGGREGSQRGICRELAVRGIKSPSGKAEWNPVYVNTVLHDEVYSNGIWHYGRREYVEPEFRRDPNAEHHRVRNKGVLKPREDWAGSIVMPGGPIWTADEQGAILEALKRNGAVSAGKPKTVEGREALLKGLCKCAAIITKGERIGQECGRAMAPEHGRVRIDGTRALWYRCNYRNRVTGEHYCDYDSANGEWLEESVWLGAKRALCEDLDALIAAHYSEIVTKEEESELATLRAEFERKTRMRREAMRKEIESHDAADKAEYAGLVSRYKADLAILDRRIQNCASDAETEHLDTAAVQRKARKAFQTDDPAERRQIFLDWVQQVRYSDGWAEITIIVQIGAGNCKQAEHAVYNKQLLLTTRIQVAA